MTVDVDVVFKIIELLILPFAWHIIKRLDRLDDTGAKQTNNTLELKTILVGADGKNGMRSRVVRLERRVEHLALQQASRHGESAPFQDNEENEE